MTALNHMIKVLYLILFDFKFQILNNQGHFWSLQCGQYFKYFLNTVDNISTL